MPPAYVKPYVKRGKTDAADAEAICEAVTRPSMRFVPVKSAEQQAALALHRTRDLLVKQRTQLVNMVRGLLAEFGIEMARGLHHALSLAARLSAGDAPEVPPLIRRARTKPEGVDPRLVAMLERKPARVVTVAAANRTARVAWAIMTRGGTYQAPLAAAA